MTRLVNDEIDILAELVPALGPQVIELGCGAARMARQMLQRWPGLRYVGLEVDTIQHARNLQDPPAGMRFVAAGAQDIPCEDGQFDLALMLKSLHHVPLGHMDQALAEVHRVLRPGGHLYVSEPVFAGALNDITRLFNDEQAVRAAAQAALNRAVASGAWVQARELRFEVPVHFADFGAFERRMLDVTYAERHFDGGLRERVRARFEPHVGPGGAHFQRPMHVRLLRRS